MVKHLKNSCILIIEDESGIADIITYPLSTEGFETIWVNTGKEGLKKLDEINIDLIILDIGLPDINGFELIKIIRKKHNIPVIFLTARKEEIDRVLGLELGGDDYVTKPFSPRELVARVKAVLRRHNLNKDSSYPSDSVFRVDNNKRQIYYFDKLLDLSKYEYDILSLLLSRPGWVFRRDMIMNQIWEEPEMSFERTVDAHIKNLRAKLKEINSELDPIITHRGVGYSIKEKL